MVREILRYIALLNVALLTLCVSLSAAAAPDDTKIEEPGFVGIVDLDMLILPGTQAYLKRSISDTATNGGRALVVYINTPGGILQNTQEMVRDILNAPIPIILYVAPSGSTSTSAGVFITLAGHIAAMAPGTSMGAAHPVSGEGQDIGGDMRKKVENMASALVRSIAEERGRNAEWAVKAVMESNSITDQEALKRGVIDLIAKDLDELLRGVKGKEVKVGVTKVKLEDLSSLRRVRYEPNFQDRTINVLANPTVAALLWLGATTGLSLELYNPGLIIPGLIGVICLILALIVNGVVPLNQGALALFVAGALMIGAELFIPSGIFGVFGVIAMVIGAMYLVDVSQAPGMAVNLWILAPVAFLCAGFMLIAVTAVVRTMSRQVTTGKEGLIGVRGRAVTEITPESGKVFVVGEYWNAIASGAGKIEKDSEIEVLLVKDGLLLEVKRV